MSTGRSCRSPEPRWRASAPSVAASGSPTSPDRYGAAAAQARACHNEYKRALAPTPHGAVVRCNPGAVRGTTIQQPMSMDQATRGVFTVAQSVLEQLDLEVVLDRVLEAARELTGARYAALGVLDATRDHLERFLTLGIDDETRRTIGPLPTGRGVLGELIRHPHPLRIADVGSHPYSYGFPVGHPPMSSFLGVPIIVGDEPYGNLYLTEKHDAREFTEDDERSLML